MQPKHGESDTGIKGGDRVRARGKEASKLQTAAVAAIIPGRCLEHQRSLCLLCRLCEGWHIYAEPEEL